MDLLSVGGRGHQSVSRRKTNIYERFLNANPKLDGQDDRRTRACNRIILARGNYSGVHYRGRLLCHLRVLALLAAQRKRKRRRPCCTRGLDCTQGGEDKTVKSCSKPKYPPGVLQRWSDVMETALSNMRDRVLRKIRIRTLGCSTRAVTTLRQLAHHRPLNSFESQYATPPDMVVRITRKEYPKDPRH